MGLSLSSLAGNAINLLGWSTGHPVTGTNPATAITRLSEQESTYAPAGVKQGLQALGDAGNAAGALGSAATAIGNGVTYVITNAKYAAIWVGLMVLAIALVLMGLSRNGFRTPTPPMVIAP